MVSMFAVLLIREANGEKFIGYVDAIAEIMQL